MSTYKNPIISNQAISLTCYESETLELPISIFADRQDLFVKLTANQLTNLVSNGENQRLTSKENTISYILGYQGEINGVSQYACLVPHYQLKKGTYTGNVVVKNKPSNGFDTPDTNPILSLIPVSIQVLEHPLNETTKWTKPNTTEKYTVKDMLTNLYEFIYLRASYLTKNLDDTYSLNYRLTDNKTKVLTFRTENLDALPFGAVCHVISKNQGTVIAKLDLFNTNSTGYAENDLTWQISKDNRPISYCLVNGQDLPIGEYIYFAEYTLLGKVMQTEYRSFKV